MAKEAGMYYVINKSAAENCAYGEIVVYASQPGIYFCGANWNPSRPAGGYCGIQQVEDGSTKAICSVWPTTPPLLAKATYLGAGVSEFVVWYEQNALRTFGPSNWKVGEAFRYFLQKRPGSLPNTTEVQCFTCDNPQSQWTHFSTIESPDGDATTAPFVTTLASEAIIAFLENYKGWAPSAAKLATYRIWLGTDLDHMDLVTYAEGNGTWGKFNDAFFKAEGDPQQLQNLFASLQSQCGAPVFGPQDGRIGPITSQPMPANVVAQLKLVM